MWILVTKSYVHTSPVVEKEMPTAGCIEMYPLSLISDHLTSWQLQLSASVSFRSQTRVCTYIQHILYLPCSLPLSRVNFTQTETVLLSQSPTSNIRYQHSAFEDGHHRGSFCRRVENSSTIVSPVNIPDQELINIMSDPY